MQLERIQDELMLKRNLFLVTHVILPGVILGLLFAGLEWSGADIWLSTHFYQRELNQWPYKDHWLIQRVLHKGGRMVFFLLAGSILLLLGYSHIVKSGLQKQRRELIFLFLASITGPLIIMWLKNHTHIYCPWDLQIFGSSKPYIRFFDAVFESLPVGHCFPAAHAGSGFTYVSLYFFFWLTSPRYRFFGLFFGLFLGSLYGFTQQMRGAHFFSHDVMSLMICWYVSLTLFLLFFGRQVRWQ